MVRTTPTNEQCELVVVTPIFEDREASNHLFLQLRQTLGPTIHIVAVDDGSIRQPVNPEDISAAGLRGDVIRLRRNFGHQRAIAVGINYTAKNFPGATCVVMDSDGEDRPASVPNIVAPLADESVDVVVAQRMRRAETLRFKAFYFIYKRLFHIMTGREISFGNFMALKPSALKRLSAMHELGIHVASCVLVSRLRMNIQPIDRGARYSGKSKMNFSSLVLHGFRAIMVFAEDVLVRVGIACAAVAAISIFAITVPLVLKSIGMATPGWATTVLAFLILILSQTGVLTLMTLLLTGVSKGNYNKVEYLDLIDEVIPTTPAHA